MSITPRGLSIQEAYRLYRENSIIVNRQYQRKLVWSVDQKKKLIESIMSGYPIPLILLAEMRHDNKDSFEIIDGIQRLNAIFSFIENNYDLSGRFFDVRESARAKLHSDEGVFEFSTEGKNFLTPTETAGILDYQLAISVYSADDEYKINDVFGRINSGGKHLSDQERRQAGIINPFANVTRELASEIRGDASRSILPLSDMPEISIESRRNTQGYSLVAEDIFWVKQGILSINNLRDGEDESMLVDLVASILLNDPVAASREFFDDLYNIDTASYKKVAQKLSLYGVEKIKSDVKTVISEIKNSIESVNNDQNYLRKNVNPKARSNPIKYPFYAIFMAFYDMIIKESRFPQQNIEIMESLKDIHKKLKNNAHYANTIDRRKNIKITKGLISEYFLRAEPTSYGAGNNLIIDFENSLRRSKIENNRYEVKQGILDLSSKGQISKNLLEKLPKIICGISNVGPDDIGVILLRVADNIEDAEKIKVIYQEDYIQFQDHYIVGVEREAHRLNMGLEDYMRKIIQSIESSILSEPLKSDVLSKIDAINYREKTIIRIVIPRQPKLSFLGDKSYIREGSDTKELTGPRMINASDRFSRTV